VGNQFANLHQQPMQRLLFVKFFEPASKALLAETCQYTYLALELYYSVNKYQTHLVDIRTLNNGG